MLAFATIIYELNRMCGIVGYLGKNLAVRVLIDGLKRLEYRGYDSAGLAVANGKGFKVVKKAGRVGILEAEVEKLKTKATCGISHTRWATHGGVTDANAHPHLSSDGKIALVHNGVVENFLSIKKFLLNKGYTFASETDTEVLSNLVAYHYAKEPEAEGKSRFLESVRKSLLHVDGTYGIAVMCIDCPHEIIGARKSSPLVLGIGDGEYLLASDVVAFAMRTQNVVYLRDGEIVHVKSDSFTLSSIAQAEDIEAVIQKVEWDIEAAEIGQYRYFMEKEIFEQPTSLQNAMRGRFAADFSTAHFGGLGLTAQELRQVDRILFCSCGTAWHACLVAEYLIERYARIPVEVEYASEFRYRNSPLDKHTLVFVVSQSGETLDTLEALRESKRKGYKTLAICNTVGSSIARESDGGIYQHSGPEIGVASTKAFTSQLCIVAMMALYLGRLRDMSYEEGAQFVAALQGLPAIVESVLQTLPAQMEALAHKYAHHESMLFLGRQALFPLALEGALKVKELSYIHAEGYPAAEMKHGPIALISHKCPTIFLATQQSLLPKLVSSIQEIRARHGEVIGIFTEGAEVPPHLVNDSIWLPEVHEALQPIVAAIPLQLFAFYAAIQRGCDIDKPRNLAKSVTVE